MTPMTTVDDRPITASDIRRMLRAKYYSNTDTYNQTVILEEVANGTGWTQDRWIDVAVFEMWHSKGLSRSAFEIKVSRHDFLQELDHPEKHQWCRDSFHFFWFVAPKDIIQIEELPAGVGWMYPRGEKLCVARHAKRNDDPKLDDVLLAAFMRAAHKEIRGTERLVTNEFKSKDRDYQRALWYSAAVTKFLQTHAHRPIYPESQQEIETALNDATMDKVVKEEREQLLNIGAKFQRDIIALLSLFLIVAKKGILAREEMGQYIVKTYGGVDPAALEVLKERAKGDKSVFQIERAYADMVETLLGWEKLSNERHPD